MNNITHLSKMFESNIRLQIIASLYQGDLSYKKLKEVIDETDDLEPDGNMAKHLNKLIQNQFILKHKVIYNDKPLTTYHLTNFGKDEFQKYVAVLQKAIEPVTEEENTNHD